MKVTVTAKIDLKTLGKIRELIDSGRYSCIEDFIVSAIKEKLEEEDRGEV